MRSVKKSLKHIRFYFFPLVALSRRSTHRSVSERTLKAFSRIRDAMTQRCTFFFFGAMNRRNWVITLHAIKPFFFFFLFFCFVLFFSHYPYVCSQIRNISYASDDCRDSFFFFFFLSFFLSFFLNVLTSVEDIRRGSVYKCKRGELNKRGE